MNADAVIAEYEVRSGSQRGSRLVLYGNRLLQQGQDLMESVPLAHLASVRVAFERNVVTLNWAIVLLIVALGLALVAGPLQGAMASMAARLAEPGRRDGIEAFLLAGFQFAGGVASFLPVLAAAMTAGAALLLWFFWLGHTTLTLAFAATERACAVRGRDQFLQDFAETLAARVAALRPPG
jgi:hypothetical protein